MRDMVLSRLKTTNTFAGGNSILLMLFVRQLEDNLFKN